MYQMGLILLVGLFLASGDTDSKIAEKNASPCYPMHICGSTGGGDYLGQGPAPGGVHAEPTYWHSDCKYCGGFDPDPCHSPCEGIIGQADVKAGIEAVLGGMKDRNVAAVIAAVASAGEYVQWNEQRKAVQVLACDHRSVMASWTLGREFAGIRSQLADALQQ